MSFRLEIRTNSSPFHGDPEDEKDLREYPDGFEPGRHCRQEVRNILHRISEDLRRGKDVTHFQTILDSKGNDVGRYRLLMEKED